MQVTTIKASCDAERACIVFLSGPGPGCEQQKLQNQKRAMQVVAINASCHAELAWKLFLSGSGRGWDCAAKQQAAGMCPGAALSASFTKSNNAPILPHAWRPFA